MKTQYALVGLCGDIARVLGTPMTNVQAATVQQILADAASLRRLMIAERFVRLGPTEHAKMSRLKTQLHLNIQYLHPHAETEILCDVKGFSVSAFIDSFSGSPLWRVTDAHLPPLIGEPRQRQKKIAARPSRRKAKS